MDTVGEYFLLIMISGELLNIFAVLNLMFLLENS